MPRRCAQERVAYYTAESTTHATVTPRVCTDYRVSLSLSLSRRCWGDFWSYPGLSLSLHLVRAAQGRTLNARVYSGWRWRQCRQNEEKQSERETGCRAASCLCLSAFCSLIAHSSHSFARRAVAAARKGGRRDRERERERERTAGRILYTPPPTATSERVMRACAIQFGSYIISKSCLSCSRSRSPFYTP